MKFARRYIPSYGELTADDYAEMGLISGLEVHQQLLTEKKLFCRCPAGRYEKSYDAEILRHMRPTLSELGEYDPTALMEFKKKKEVVYQLQRDTVCTYDMDDAPPFELNREALEKSLTIALQFECNIVGEIHISRKQYLDGSIPAGFQRTMIVGTDGRLYYNGREIRVVQLALEEDACREAKEEGHYIYFRTDRLSTPLIEVVTAPEMNTPWDVAGVGQAIRELTRATGLVRRGAGSGRQDVNVSIKGGERCEIKGVQSIRYIPSLVHYEALRQKALLEIREMLKEKGLELEEFKAESRDVTETLKNTAFDAIREAVSRGGRAYAVKLPGFREILTYPTGPRANFGREISERVRVIACLDKLPNILYRDLVGIQIAGHQWRRIENLLKARDEDGIVVVWGDEKDARTAVGEIELRAREAFIGVPRETRQANSDGGTGFERMLPGPDRMYPDTDMPPIAVGDEDIEKARKKMVTPPHKRRERLEKQGLPVVFVKSLIAGGRAELAEKIFSRLTLSKNYVAYLLGGFMRHLKRKGYDTELIPDDELFELFEFASSGKILPAALPGVIETALREGASLREIAERKEFEPAPEREIDEVIGEIYSTAEKPISKDSDAVKKYYAGKIMEKLRYRVDGKMVLM
ncbi:MAG: Glu-tRNA(Gln) amidotransferase subunit GatE [Myxococcota bacterium]